MVQCAGVAFGYTSARHIVASSSVLQQNSMLTFSGSSTLTVVMASTRQQ